MTFTERLSASEQRAHSQLTATKILKELSELRANADESPISPRRWVWELIQNAKDVGQDGRVAIQIESQLDGHGPHVAFRHTGRPFTAENVRFLIEQISSKDRHKDDMGRPRTTGKFGTGFLTTHLLSDRVVVNGVAAEEDWEPRQFELLLDRSGFDLEAITAAVEQAKSSLQNLDDRAPCSDFIEGEFNTSFRYELTDESGVYVAKAGLADLETCLPYTLAFVREIESVTHDGRTFSLRDEVVQALDCGARLSFVTIRSVSESGDSDIQQIVMLNRDLTTIALPAQWVNGGNVNLIEPGLQVPRLHCDFPLIGTESFPFPVLINSPVFNPTDSRDGIFLTTPSRPNPLTDENKQILVEALELYFEFLKYASSNGWGNLHLLAKVRPIPDGLLWADGSWFEASVLNPVRNELLHSPIVRTANGRLASILNEDGSRYMWFPAVARRELRDKLWKCCAEWFPHCLPDQRDVDFWSSIAWDECGKLTPDQLAAFVEARQDTSALAELLSGHDVFAWLRKFYDLFDGDDIAYSTLHKRKVFPNQYGQLCKSFELHKDGGDLDPALLDILRLLGQDVRAELLSSSVDIEIEHLETIDQSYLVKQITSEVHEKTTDRDVARNYRDAFQKLLLWFRQHPKLASSLFPGILRAKHLLYDDEQILENIERAEQLNLLLAEFEVTSVEELRKTIAAHRPSSQLLPVTQEIITRMGICSVEEWERALEDKDLAALFSHESTPTTDMFVYAQSIIQRAKKRVIEHLSALEGYDLTGHDETAPTVLAGIKKDGRHIMIVVRPAYDGEVIIYYGSERDVLDYEDSELWVDDGEKVRRVTLGGILKTTQIRRFPV